MLGTIVEQVVKAETLNPKSETLNKSEIQNPKFKNIGIIIASGDMDTLQLVHGTDVQVYTLKKGIKDTVLYDEDAVRERFGFGPEQIPDYKGLRGDTSDNIIGVKGIGEKTATTLITTFGTIEKIYEELEAGHDGKFTDVGITPRIIQLLKDSKEEAEFSKMLATINRHAPVEFVIPDKTFKEALDIEKVTALWNELEFRTLTQRLKKIVGGDGDLVGPEKGRGPAGRPAGREGGRGSSRMDLLPFGDAPPSAQSDPIDPDELNKTLLALWVVDSDRTDPSLEDLYNFANTEDFEAARKAVLDELSRKDVKNVYEKIELPLIPVIDRMEKRGIKVDRSVLADLSKTYHVEADKLQKEIWKHAGTEFNISSPKQLGEVLFDKLGLHAKGMKKTAGGARSTRESELEKLRDQHPIVSLIFDYRELTKLLSTYIDAIPPLLDDKDRLHSRLVSAGAATGRMASQNPNLQNIPIRSELGRAIRRAFIAEDGFKLCAFDYSQMELRIAAFLSGDEKMIDIFKSGEDVHASVASFVFKVPQDEVTADMRRHAKAINFGMIYGMGVVSLQRSIGTDRATAQKFYDDYFRTFSTLASYLDAIKAETARRGYTETFFGRRRYFQGIHSKIPYVRAQAERMAINAPIQGTEADIIKIAMVEIDKYIEEEGLRDDVSALLQVHDELIYEVRADKVEAVSARIRDIMQSVMSLQDTRGVILKAEAHAGDDWGELK